MGKIIGYVVAEGTGEILNEVREGDKLTRAESIRKLKAGGDFVNVPKDAGFIKLYTESVPLLIEEGLNVSEFVIFLFLASNIRYESNISKYGNGVLINRGDLMKNLKCSEPTVQRSVTALVKRGMIAEVKIAEGKCFFVNPYICGKGNKYEKSTIDLFKKTKWFKSWSKGL